MFIILVLYVDDILIVSKRMVEINRLKDQLSRTFDMKDLGAEKLILGMEIDMDRKILSYGYHKRSMHRKSFQRFNMDKVKLVNILLSSHYNISLGMCPSNDE